MATGDEIRPIYMQLQDCRIEAPEVSECAFLEDPAVWESYHAALAELGRAVGKNYRRFALTVQKDRDG